MRTVGPCVCCHRAAELDSHLCCKSCKLKQGNQKMEQCQGCGEIRALDNGICLDCAMAVAGAPHQPRTADTSIAGGGYRFEIPMGQPSQSRVVNLPCGDGKRIEIQVFGELEPEALVSKLLEFTRTELEAILRKGAGLK